MLLPVWSFALAIFGASIFHIGGVQSQCWESSKCMDFTNENDILECTNKACNMVLSDNLNNQKNNMEEDVLGRQASKRAPSVNHFRWTKPIVTKTRPIKVISSDDQIARNSNLEEEPFEKQENKRAPSVNHFRWAKPVIKKKRPIVFGTEMTEESYEDDPMDFKRDLQYQFDYPVIDSWKNLEDSDEISIPNKQNGNYRVYHTQWARPLDHKRHGVVITSQSSETPLMAFFKNAYQPSQ
ncbi:pro-opiomelanocortin B-like [Discoglossus pictus]